MGIIVLLALLALTPYASTRFWWMLAAFLALVATHAIYWFVTHPNNFWNQGHSADRHRRDVLFSLCRRHHWRDWAKLRDVWEYSHLARSVFAMLSLVFLLIAVTA